MGYGLMAQVTRENMDESWRRGGFPSFTLFVFILVSNLIGYIPLPVDSQNTFKLFGAHIPSFQIYAAVPTSPFRWCSRSACSSPTTSKASATTDPRVHQEPDPAGVGGAMLLFIFPLEMLSNFVLRPLSLTIRLWANLLAGHLLIDFMAGNLAVLWPAAARLVTLPLGVIIYLFEAVLIAGLQAFIFAILTAIYLGGATAASH